MFLSFAYTLLLPLAASSPAVAIHPSAPVSQLPQPSPATGPPWYFHHSVAGAPPISDFLSALQSPAVPSLTWRAISVSIAPCVPFIRNFRPTGTIDVTELTLAIHDGWWTATITARAPLSPTPPGTWRVVGGACAHAPLPHPDCRVAPAPHLHRSSSDELDSSGLPVAGTGNQRHRRLTQSTPNLTETSRFRRRYRQPELLVAPCPVTMNMERRVITAHSHHIFDRMSSAASSRTATTLTPTLSLLACWLHRWYSARLSGILTRPVAGCGPRLIAGFP